MKMKLLTIILLPVMLALITGCETTVDTGEGAGNVVHVNGWLKFKEYNTYEKGWDAGLAAMRDLNYAVVTQEKNAVTGKIVARAAGDKKVQMEVNKISGSVVEFQIRVGSTGDIPTSKQIREAIRKHL